MAAGESAAEQASSARAVAARNRSRAERADRVAEAWERGAKGEVKVSTLLAQLAEDGYHALADRRFPDSNGNLDHIAIGPAGVFVVDAKAWTGKVTVAGNVLRQNGRSRVSHVVGVREQASELGYLLRELGLDPRPYVRPVMCFVESGPEARRYVDRVHLVPGSDLLSFVRQFERRHDQRQVDEMLARLVAALPPRTAPAPDSAHEEVVPYRPDEAVFFLQRWSKYGRRRLYVKADDGSEIGCLDLNTGAVSAVDEAWRPVLARLLPHFVSGVAAPPYAEDLSGEARGALQRFIDAILGRRRQPTAKPIVAGVRWTNYGKDRLYVNRIESDGTKTELGWTDVSSAGATQPSGANAALLCYCRDKHRALRS